MDLTMKTVERGRNDWIVVLIILVIGFLCVIAAGQLALRFAPHWQLNTDMDSHLDPNIDFLTQRPGGFIEPIDASILTQPSWLDVFLTPGASFVTATPFPIFTRTRFASPAPTIVSSVTNTAVAAKSPTNTLVYFPPTQTSTSRPASTDTSISTQVPTLPTTLVDPSTPTATATPPIPTDPLPPEIGTTPDGLPYYLPAGGTLTLGTNLVANGDPDFDLVYYEFPSGSGIWLDWVIVEISDGNNWYTVFNWYDNNADTNSNMNFDILSLPVPPPVEEIDQRDILAADLYTSSSGVSTGIAIDIDAVVPPGTYPYIRFSAPAGDLDGQLEIDAIEILP
jgi:hypothetical protein